MRAVLVCVIFVAALGASLVLGGCGRSRGAEAPGTITFLIETMPISLDPRIGTDAQSQHLDGLLFNSLVRYDGRMNIVPDLAESWDMPDPRTYVFHLRRGVKFHDGRTLTSADVKFTFDSIFSGAVKTAKRGLFPAVDSITTPNDSTVVFRLLEPDASFLWDMASPAVGIVRRGSGADVAIDPVGTGPFRFVSMKEDEEIVLERNPEYFGGNGGGNIERVTFRVVPEEVVRALELRKGTADIGGVNSLTPDTVLALTKQPDLIATEQPGTVIAYAAFNLDDPILAHREVRQALAYATDRPTLIQYLLRGEVQAAANLLPPSHWAFNPNVKQYNYDPAESERLLDEAGYRRGADGTRFRLTLKTSTEESARLLGQALADEWKRVGVNLELRPLENATLLSDIGKGSFQLYTLRWIGPNNDPAMFDFVFNSKKTPPHGQNRGHYRNPALDKLIEQEKVETDREKRKALVWKIQEIVAEDEPYINLWYYDNVCVHRDTVTDIELPPGGDYDFLASARIRN